MDSDSGEFFSAADIDVPGEVQDTHNYFGLPTIEEVIDAEDELAANTGIDTESTTTLAGRYDEIERQEYANQRALRAESKLATQRLRGSTIRRQRPPNIHRSAA